jgi:hypothetical protein
MEKVDINEWVKEYYRILIEVEKTESNKTLWMDDPKYQYNQDKILNSKNSNRIYFSFKHGRFGKYIYIYTSLCMLYTI